MYRPIQEYNLYTLVSSVCNLFQLFCNLWPSYVKTEGHFDKWWAHCIKLLPVVTMANASERLQDAASEGSRMMVVMEIDGVDVRCF